MPGTTDYAALPDQLLIDLLFTEEDRLPRVAVDEIIRRGVPIAPALFRILEDDTLWADDSSRWWALVHATYLLASMQPPGALDALVRVLEKAEDNDLDWLTDDARHLLGSFGPRAIPVLAPLALDRGRKSFFRMSINGALAWIGQNHAEAKEEVAGALRAIIRNKRDDHDVRVWAASDLLDLALPEDHDLILSMADGDILGKESVEKTYSGEAQPRKEPNDDWMRFYDPDEIAQREARRREQDFDPAKEDDGGHDPAPSLEDLERGSVIGDVLTEPAENEPGPIRAEPKIGRNEPCPCGSGKKHKKCCGR